MRLHILLVAIAICLPLPAGAQTARNAMQRELTGTLGTVGATHVRFLFGFPFAVLALLAGGEWLRRSDKGLPTLPLADIPAALTGAGAVAAFGTIYAAHALYDFIGPAFTFIALAAVAMGTLVLAGLHGPLLGAIGLVAAIPATIAYNKLAGEVNKIASRLEGFADEFSAILSRQIDERA